MSRLCVPTISENPLRLSPLFHDYWAEQMAAFTARTDVLALAGCYVPRYYHAPDSETQFQGVAANGYLTYLLSLPIGSFLCGYLHTTSSAPLSAAAATASGPPNLSGFRCQITDLALGHKFFSVPVSEAWFINDQLLGVSALPPYPNNSQGYTFPSFPRLLPVMHPIVDPGQLQVEFWNSLDETNTDVQMTFLVMVPDGPGVVS